MSIREECDHKDRCGATGHYLPPGSKTYVRCQCLQLEMNKKALGAFYTKSPRKDTPLAGLQDTDLVIQGPFRDIKNHVAGALLQRSEKRKQWISIDAYRLIEIFLDEDAEFTTQTPITETDLLIVLLGFGDPRNRYLPELLLQVLSRRELTEKPTWVILGTTLDRTASKYSTEIHERLRQFKNYISIK